jgi:hypothetical protein
MLFMIFPFHLKFDYGNSIIQPYNQKLPRHWRSFHYPSGQYVQVDYRIGSMDTGENAITPSLIWGDIAVLPPDAEI